jgi:hypothetical protein
MKVNSAVSKILTSKLVLHIVSFLALFNVIGYMVIGHYNCVFSFILLAVLIRYFSKNMIVVLGIPLLLVNIMALNNNNSYYEGLENNKTDNNKEKEPKRGSTQKTAQDSDVDAAGERNIKSKNEDESFEVGRSKNRGHKIDYATTIEEAYDQLNSILGKDGIKSLTSDTERLMNQQKNLAGSLKDMGPLMEKMAPMMEQMEGMMKTFDTGNKNDVMGKVSGMLESLKKK